MSKLILPIFLLLILGCTPKSQNVISQEKIIENNPVSNEMIHSSVAHQNAIFGSNWKTYFIVPNPTKAKITSRSFSGTKACHISHKENGISVVSTHTNKMLTKPDTVVVHKKTDQGEANISYTLSIQKNEGAITYVTNNEELQAAFAKTKNNRTTTTIFLNTGEFGHISFNNLNNITVVPATDQQPKISSISINNSRKIKILSLDIHAESTEGKNAYYVKIDSSSSDITISNCKIQAAEETEIWEPSDWKTKAANGIYSEGENCIFTHNYIQHIHHGLETKGNNCLVSNNIIIRFAGDAIRNTGDHNTFDSNYMADALVDDYSAKDGNHDDLFQSWTFDKPIKNLVIKNNIALSCTDTTNHLQSKNIQGLACFDGFEENWIVENNLVVIEHPHGIALFGAKNCQIKNNKIIPNPFNKYEFESQPWIMIHDHKDGRKSLNNLINNNLVSVLKIDDTTAVVKNNTLINTDPVKTFPKYAHWIF